MLFDKCGVIYKELKAENQTKQLKVKQVIHT